jgi:hypothetical protein
VSAVTPTDLYLHATINRHRAPPDDDRGDRLRRQIEPLLRGWSLGNYLESVALSGSHAKSTALRDSDVDLFLSLSPDTPGPLTDIHASLADYFRDYFPRPRNVSLRIQLDGSAIDLVPGRRRAGTTHHTLWQLRYDTWLQTDIGEQIRYVRSSGLSTETVGLKLWRRRHALRFPSFLLELVVVRALTMNASDALCTNPRTTESRAAPCALEPSYRISESFTRLLNFLATAFPSIRLVDPANSNNIVSDCLNEAEKRQIASTADASLHAACWTNVI